MQATRNAEQAETLRTRGDQLEHALAQSISEYESLQRELHARNDQFLSLEEQLREQTRSFETNYGRVYLGVKNNYFS